MHADVRAWFGGHLLRRGRSELVALQASRPLLESRLRARVRGMRSVRFIDGCNIAGLTTADDGHRVTGARVIRRLDRDEGLTLTADLVVDTTGRGSRTPTWLETLGFPRPLRQQVHVGVGYASRTYRPGSGALAGDLGILIAATPDHPRGGAATMMEDDRLLLTLFGILGDHPPTDPDGFDEFAASLPFPDLHRALRAAEPLDEPVAFRHPVSVRHHYEQLARFPDGLLVMGDAVCTFNPVYGQGMSVAALEALTLRAHLQRYGEPRPHSFFRQISGILDVAWDLATGGDLAFPGVAGRRTPKVRILNRYLNRLLAVASHDPRLAQAFLSVAGLVDPPRTLLAPRVAVRVLRPRPRTPFRTPRNDPGGLGGGSAGTATPAPEPATRVVRSGPHR